MFSTDLGQFAHWVSSFQYILIAVSISSARIFAAFSILPFTGDGVLQGMTKNGVVLVIAAFIAFGVPADSLRHLDAVTLGGLVLKESFIGLLLGFCGSTVFWVAQSVGALIDTQAGYNSVQQTNPLSGEQSTPVSDLLLQLIISIFYSLGGMMAFIGAVFDSFKVWPMLSPLPSMKGFAEVFFLSQVDGLMTSVVKFAAPALLVLLLIDLGFGLMTRAADKLQPSSLSQPIKGAVTMLLLAFMVGVFVTQVRYALLPADLVTRLQAMLVKG